MAGSLNQVQLIGHLGRDPEVKMLDDGKRIAQLSIATSERWKAKDTGERQERTEWHRVVIFNQSLAEVAEKYLKKGALVYVRGKLQTRKWTDKAGQERYTTEIVFPAFGGELTMLDPAPASGARPPDPTSDDEMPF